MLEFEMTERGFVAARFVDRYGKPCRLQKSSLASEECIWLGTEEYMMHLTKGMVTALMPALNAFVETGNITPKEPAPEPGVSVTGATTVASLLDGLMAAPVKPGLLERLEDYQVEFSDGVPCGWGPPINPDGPEAAAAIRGLQARVAAQNDVRYAVDFLLLVLKVEGASGANAGLYDGLVKWRAALPPRESRGG